MDISAALQALTPVNPGDFVGEAASSTRINAIQTLLFHLTGGHHIVTGPGIRKRTGEGFVSLTAEVPVGGGRSGGNILAFEVIDATDKLGLKVQVVDGKVNDKYPSGMGYIDPSTGEFYIYKINLVEEAYQAILLYVTYNVNTLEITSRTLGRNDFPPANTQGTLIIKLADVYVTYNAHGDKLVTIDQKEIGDVSFKFIFGAFNGAPALLAVKAFSEWTPVLPVP